MARGVVIQRAYQERIRAEKDSQLVTTRCLWCKVKPVTSTLAEGRLWLAEHVKEKHPERTHARKFVRRSSSHRMLGRQSLDENIAAARAQGASAWVNREETEWV